MQKPQALQENVVLQKKVLKPLRLIILSCLLICNNSFAIYSFPELVANNNVTEVAKVLITSPHLISVDITAEGLKYLELPKNLKLRLDYDSGVKPLHVAAALGYVDMVELLLANGGDKWSKTAKYKSFPAQLAVQNGHFTVFDSLNGVKPSSIRVTVDLENQIVSVYDGVTLLKSSKVSSGRKGYATPKGSFIITDKHSKHTSTIYKVSMPFFMRFSYSAIGLHQGYATGTPRSHGCIRLPPGNAKAIFQLCPVGTRVEVY